MYQVTYIRRYIVFQNILNSQVQGSKIIIIANNRDLPRNRNRLLRELAVIARFRSNSKHDRLPSHRLIVPCLVCTRLTWSMSLGISVPRAANQSVYNVARNRIRRRIYVICNTTALQPSSCVGLQYLHKDIALQ